MRVMAELTRDLIGCRSRPSPRFSAWSSTSPTCSRTPPITSATASTSSCEGKRRTYAEMEERANRLAHHLAAHGIGPGDHVGIYAYNSVEWVETLWAVFKIRAVWVNINYRYVEDELALPLRQRRPQGARLPARVRAPGRAACSTALPMLAPLDRHRGRQRRRPRRARLGRTSRTRWPSGSPERDFAPALRRRPLHPLHRRHDGHAQGRGLAPRGRLLRARRRHRRRRRHDASTAPRRWSRRACEPGAQATMLPIAPLMHGATQWGVMGGSVRRQQDRASWRSSSRVAVWQLVAAEKVNSIMITGDAMARPLIEALDDPEVADARPVVVVRRCRQHRGAVLPVGEGPVPRAVPEPDPHRRDRLVGERHQRLHDDRAEGQDRDEGRPDRHADHGHRRARREPARSSSAGSGVDRQGRPRGQHPARVLQGPGEDGRDVRHRGRRRPLRRSPATSRPSRPTARSRLLGRGSVSINSGGEKIYPEEVEAAVKSPPRRVRLHRRRRARRALGPARRRGRPAA